MSKKLYAVPIRQVQASISTKNVFDMIKNPTPFSSGIESQLLQVFSISMMKLNTEIIKQDTRSF